MSKVLAFPVRSSARVIYPTNGALALAPEFVEAEPEIETQPTRKAQVEIIPFPGAFERVKPEPPPSDSDKEVRSCQLRRNRWYDPQARRFVSQDQTPVDEFQPDKIHRYAAFGLNPISNVDPMGADYITNYVNYKYNDAVIAPVNQQHNPSRQKLRDIRNENNALVVELLKIPSSNKNCVPWKNWITAKRTELRNYSQKWWIWWKWGRHLSPPTPIPVEATADLEYVYTKDFLWVPQYWACHRRVQTITPDIQWNYFGVGAQFASPALQYNVGTEIAPEARYEVARILKNVGIRVLGRLIYAEASNQSLNAMKAVGAVVRNRAIAGPSSSFPTTYKGVIFQHTGFTSVGDEKWAEADVGFSNPSYDRALEVARGIYNLTIPDPTNTALYFHSDKITDPGNHWFNNAFTAGTIVHSLPGLSTIGPFTLYK